MKDFFTSLFLVFPMILSAQNDVALSTDRPTMCAAPYVISQKHLQLESGVESGWNNWHSITLPTAMLRYGLTRFAEVDYNIQELWARMKARGIITPLNLRSVQR